MTHQHILLGLGIAIAVAIFLAVRRKRNETTAGTSTPPFGDREPPRERNPKPGERLP